MSNREKLIQQTRRDIERLKASVGKPLSRIGLIVYGGTLGLLFVVPIVCGAYLGLWLDTLAQGYSVRWTVSLILLGIGIGSYNVFLFMRSKT